MTDRLIEVGEDDDYPLDDFLKEETVKTDKMRRKIMSIVVISNKK